MTATTVTTKFSVGDVAYYVMHPTADILQGIVTYIRIIPTDPTFEITYRIQRTNVLQIIDYIHEDNLYTFDEAKAELLSWLSDQTIKITNSSEPPVPPQPPTV